MEKIWVGKLKRIDIHKDELMIVGGLIYVKLLKLNIFVIYSSNGKVSI